MFFGIEHDYYSILPLLYISLFQLSTTDIVAILALEGESKKKLIAITSKSRQNDNYLYFDSSRSDNNRLTKDRSTDLHQKSKVVKRVNLTKSSREKLNIDIAKMKILQFGRAPKLFRIFWAPIIFSATVLFFLQDTKK